MAQLDLSAGVSLLSSVGSSRHGVLFAFFNVGKASMHGTGGGGGGGRDTGRVFSRVGTVRSACNCGAGSVRELVGRWKYVMVAAESCRT